MGYFIIVCYLTGDDHEKEVTLLMSRNNDEHEHLLLSLTPLTSIKVELIYIFFGSRVIKYLNSTPPYQW